MSLHLLHLKYVNIFYLTIKTHVMWLYLSHQHATGSTNNITIFSLACTAGLHTTKSLSNLSDFIPKGKGPYQMSDCCRQNTSILCLVDTTTVSNYLLARLYMIQYVSGKAINQEICLFLFRYHSSPYSEKTDQACLDTQSWRVGGSCGNGDINAPNLNM